MTLFNVKKAYYGLVLVQTSLTNKHTTKHTTKPRIDYFKTTVVINRFCIIDQAIKQYYLSSTIILIQKSRRVVSTLFETVM